MPPKSTMRSPDARDADIGQRVRVQRLAKGLSQGQLGKHLGVTFQQVQKYEGGVNRIGSGRLQRIAEVLGVPVSFFFSNDGQEKSSAPGDVISPLDYLSTEGAIRLVRAFSQIADGNLRHAIVQIVEKLASESAPRKRKNSRK